MALPAPSVLEVLQSAPCTPLARAPSAVLGVINLRGQIVATVDLRPLCLVVDEVIDMVDADDAQLLPVPDASATAAHLYAASILALKGEILLVLDVDRVVDAVRGSAKSAA
jgi:purine-binding chemotaxis protein CheW